MKYTDDELTLAVQECKTWAETCRRLGVAPLTGSQWHMKKRATRLKLDTSHFVGNASNKGRVFGPKNQIEYYLVKDGPHINSHTLRLRLIKEGIKEAKCEVCQNVEWLGKPIPLELHHKNSEHKDNRLENLEINCPNCHAMQPKKNSK